MNVPQPESFLAIRGIQITARDKEICVFLQQWRYANVKQLAKKFGTSTPAMYRRLDKLCRASIIKHEKVLADKPGVYRCLPKGRMLADTNLPPVERISEHFFRHTVAAVDVALALEQESPRLLSEQELRSDKGINVFSTQKGKREHCPDIIAYMPDGKVVAVEVELSVKNKERIEGIFRWYFQHSEYHEVRYYVPGEAMAHRILSYGGSRDYVKLYMLSTMREWKPPQKSLEFGG